MRWDRDLLVDLRRRYLSGEAVADLAAEAGCSPRSLTASWTTYGVAREHPRLGHQRHDWTMKLLRSIRDRWAEGETLRSLAEEVGANEGTLSSALERAGFKSRRIAKQRRTMLRARRNGRSIERAYVLRRDTLLEWSAIAEEVGWSLSATHLRTSVRRWVNRASLPPLPRRWRGGREISDQNRDRPSHDRADPLR